MKEIYESEVYKEMDISNIDKQLLLNMYRKMLAAREFEEQLYYLFMTIKMPGTMHQTTGQEAVAVGVISALNPEDYVTSTHRGHAHCIAKGLSINEMMAEMFAKNTGSCKGMGGSLHLSDIKRGMIGAFGIVGAGIPIATGAALSAKVRKSGQIAINFLGDGAVNEGVFHESLNMASLWNLPVVYIIENNCYALSMTNELSSAVINLASRGCAYNIPGIRVDGNNVVAVYKAAKKAAQLARNGEGPTILECVTYRIRGHSRFEPAKYRPPEEVEFWKNKDPIIRLENALIKHEVVNQNKLEAIRTEIIKKIEDAIVYAKAAEDVEPTDYIDYVFDNTYKG